MTNRKFLSELVLHFKDPSSVDRLNQNPVDELKKLGLEPGDYFIDYTKLRKILYIVTKQHKKYIGILEKIEGKFPIVKSENLILIGVSKKGALKWLDLLSEYENK